VRACTCAGLSDLGPAAAEALPAIVNCLKETNHTVFSIALTAASNMRGRQRYWSPFSLKN